jgi:predicted lipoprotein with Yx(FWY)xxD motif
MNKQALSLCVAAAVLAIPSSLARASRTPPSRAHTSDIRTSSRAVIQVGARGVVASPAQALVKTAYNKTLGSTILVDSAGRTLYIFTEDTDGKDTACTPQGPWGAECPAIWPALTSTGAPRAGSGVKASLLGVYTRRDGKRQVTYNRHPLYYFHGDPNTPPGDKKAGDARGQGFVNEWYVLSPSGTPIRK